MAKQKRLPVYLFYSRTVVGLNLSKTGDILNNLGFMPI
jgi:hypothetical protein